MDRPCEIAALLRARLGGQRVCGGTRRLHHRRLMALHARRANRLPIAVPRRHFAHGLNAISAGASSFQVSPKAIHGEAIRIGTMIAADVNVAG